MDTRVICVFLILVVVLLSAIIAYRRRRNSAVDVLAVDVLTLHDIVLFFKRAEVSEKLKSVPNVIAVALKENGQNDRTRIVLCTYDKEMSKVCEHLAVYDVGSMDATLLNAFGNKDMLILQ